MIVDKRKIMYLVPAYYAWNNMFHTLQHSTNFLEFWHFCLEIQELNRFVMWRYAKKSHQTGIANLPSARNWGVSVSGLKCVETSWVATSCGRSCASPMNPRTHASWRDGTHVVGRGWMVSPGVLDWEKNTMCSRNNATSWWFQPIWKMLVKLHHFPK